VPSRNPDALARAMRRLADDPDAAAQMGARAREIAQEHYAVRRVNSLLLREMGLDSRQMVEGPANLTPRSIVRPASA
jgi:hypothetical protein